jgi:hypothetical protein
MTARRRRKSGSGPSATALIAWVGGARTSLSDSVGASVPVAASASIGRTAGNRAIFLGRACGLAAGTLLACGSVLAGATHVGDGSLAGDGVPLLNRLPAAPDASVGAPSEYRAGPLAEPASAAPNLVSAQVVTEPNPLLHPPLGRARRNVPLSVDMPADEPSQSLPSTAQQPWQSPSPAAGPTAQSPIAPVSPVLDPAAKGVGRVAPVGGVLAPTNPSRVRVGDTRERQAGGDRAASPRQKRPGRNTSGPVQAVKKVVAPVGNTIRPATQPAMTMLTSLLPRG